MLKHSILIISMLAAAAIAPHSEACAQTSHPSYKVPPISTASGHVPVISDAQMEECVRGYNETEWLSQELSRTYVNQYSQSEVDAYNRKVDTINSNTKWFNAVCAGKQSYSACKAAQKLNEEKGLPVQKCY